MQDAETNPDNRGANPRLNITKSYFWRRLRVSCRRTRCHDRIIAGATVIIALVGIGQFVVYRQMKKIMESSGKQTQQLIDAANIQACAATKNAEAAKEFAKTSSDNLSFYKAVSRLTVGVAHVVLDKHYMPVTHDTGARTVKVGVKLVNTEKTPAYNIRVVADLDLRNSPPKLEEYNFPSFFPLSEDPLKQGTEGGFYLSVKRFTIDQYARQRQPDVRIYVWGRFIYSDFPGQERNIPFCRYAAARVVLAKEPYEQPYTDCPAENIPKEQ